MTEQELNAEIEKEITVLQTQLREAQENISLAKSEDEALSFSYQARIYRRRLNILRKRRY